MQRWLYWTLIALALSVPSPLLARTWTDVSGRFKVEADLLAINDDVVVLKTAEGRLIAVEIKQLSVGDQAFLKSEEAGAGKLADRDKDHVWNLKGDLKVIGRLAGYFTHELIVGRRNARLFVDGTEEDKLPDTVKAILPRIVEHFETAKISDLNSLKSWLTDQGKVPHVYPIEGVRIALTSGDEISVPIFLFSSAERALLEPGLARFLALQKEKLKDEERSQLAKREALMLSSTARAYQLNAAQAAQARMLQLDLLAIDSGITDLWEVLVVPPNPYAYPFSIVVTARDSGTAQALVAERYPSFQIDAARKLSGY